MEAVTLKSLNPASVAVIGASENHNKVGGRPIYYMKKFGFTGKIFPVNPNYTTVQGWPCFPDIEDLPETPDSAVIAVDSSKAVEAVAKCARWGISTAVVMTAGFAEMGEDGHKIQRRMVEDANALGMRIVGPNAQGIANFSNGAVLNFSTMFMDIQPQDGPIALVSQSGAASVMPYANLRQAGLGVRYLIATGNDSDLGVSELTRTVALDPAIRLILVYMEAINNPNLLAEAAEIANRRGAKIVLLKGGNSIRGAVVSASHTGALTVNDGAFDAFLRHHGIWRARDIHEMVNAAPLYVTGHEPKGERTIIMSHSGAVSVMCADIAERAKLPLADLSRKTLDELTKVLPNFGTASNPLDLTAAMLGKSEMFPRALDILGDDEQGDMFLISIPVAGPGYDVPSFVDASISFIDTHRKPLVVSAPQESVRREYQQRGMAIFRNEVDAINALKQYSSHTRQRVGASLPRPGPKSAHEWGGVLDEAASLDLLGSNGLPVVVHRVCANPEEAVSAFESFGNDVTLKGCAAEVPHKSEYSLVYLNLSTSHTVRVAAQDCFSKLASLGCKAPKVIIAPMVKGLHEFILGAIVDPNFGPVIMVGDGGTLVEVYKDVASLRAPFTEDDALEALQNLRVAKLFPGFRGMPRLDIEALARAAVVLGNFALAYEHSLVSVDINPVMVLEAGKGVVAVDAMVEFRRAS